MDHRQPAHVAAMVTRMGRRRAAWPAGGAPRRLALAALAALLVSAAGIPAAPAASANDPAQTLPDGALVSPLASPGAAFAPLNPHLPGYPNFTAGQAVSLAESPDHKTLLVLTSGFNQMNDAAGEPVPAASDEYVFVEDISAGRPVQTQVLRLPNTYLGIVFAPDGRSFYVSGGVDDDIHVFTLRGGTWAETGAPIALGHYRGLDPAQLAKSRDAIIAGGVGIGVRPAVAGLAITADGRTLLAANFENDSLSVINLASRTVTEVPLRPGAINRRDSGRPGGEFPLAVAVRGNDTAYVSSLRDREIDVVSLGPSPGLRRRIAVAGNPNRLLLNRAGTRLFVTADNSDDLEVIDTGREQLIARVHTIAPADMLADAGRYRGVGPNNLALSPDETTLYVSNGGTNTVAVIALGGQPRVTGLIPTGYFPNAVALAGDGAHLYVVNGKSIPGPDPGNCTSDPARHIARASCDASNQYILQLSKAGFLDLPTPRGAALAATTAIAAHDEHFDTMPNARDAAMMAALHRRIKHVIYIIRENRTYDEVLGDLGEGNGDPALAEFGGPITPNIHALASQFVDFDNFYDSGEVSGNGWPWSTTAHESDIGAKNLPVNYAGRGLSYDWEGTNRNINIALPTLVARQAAQPAYQLLPDPQDVLPGPANIAAPDGPAQQYQRGYLWDAALRAGLTVRNYGFMEDLVLYAVPAALGGISPGLTDPAASNTTVAFPANPQLAPRTDLYFRGFDNAFPDFYREREWQREFAAYVAHGDLPSLSLVRLMHDHLGSFKTAIAGVNTPETQIADNDYAVAKLVEAVAQSPYRNNTLIFIVEDDAQDGPDHVDAHRSIAFIIGPYVRHHAVVSTRYTTVNLLRTIEDILGIDHLSVNDAFQRPMTDAFDLGQKSWSFSARVPPPLVGTGLALPHLAAMSPWVNAHDAAYWAAATAGFDWSREDEVPAVKFNKILWAGLRPGKPYPKR